MALAGTDRGLVAVEGGVEAGLTNDRGAWGRAPSTAEEGGAAGVAGVPPVVRAPSTACPGGGVVEVTAGGGVVVVVVGGGVLPCSQPPGVSQPFPWSQPPGVSQPLPWSQPPGVSQPLW